MVQMRARTKDKTKQLGKAVRKINIKNLEHLLARFRMVIQKTIGQNKKPRKPGKPATSPTGQLYRSIRYATEQSTFSESGVIGPSRSDIGLIGRIQEAGGKNDVKQVQMKIRRQDGKVKVVKGPVIKTEADFPARPFMQPSFDKFRPKLSDFWADTLRGLVLGD